MVSLQEAKPWDENGLKLEDTNVGAIGSDEDKAARKEAAGTEPAWAEITDEPCMYIWRIEQFQVVPWPREHYGKFHEKDSYILLNVALATGEDGEETDKLEYDIHFWLGKKTAIDEKGTAAYKTVELDDFMDGQATQHREVHGMESEQFLDYFGGKIKYLPGGVESGFAPVQSDVFMTRLYQIRRNNKRKIIMDETTVQTSSLNHRDGFILDMGEKIYTWYGDDSSAFVKNDCSVRASNMADERNGSAEVVTEVDDGFWEALGGEEDITPADQMDGEDQEEGDEPDFGDGILYKAWVDEDRALQVEEVGRRELDRGMLDSTCLMMLDDRVEIFMWIGKDASEVERRCAMPTALNYLKANGRNPDQTAITVLKEPHGRKNKLWTKVFP